MVRKALGGRWLVGAAVVAFATGVGAGMGTVQSFLPSAQETPVIALSSDMKGLATGSFLDSPTFHPEPSPVPSRAAISSADALLAGPKAAAVAMPVPTLRNLQLSAAARQQARPAKVELDPEPPAADPVTVQRGDTLMEILLRAGIARGDAHAALASLGDVFDPRRLRPGQELKIVARGDVDPQRGGRQLMAVSLDLSFDHEIQITRTADGAFASAKVARPHRRQTVLRGGPIDDSLYLAADRAALPPDLVVELIKLFSWDVDFQRDIRPGDAFETLYDEVSLQGATNAGRQGDLLYARLTLSGREHEGYRFQHDDGRVEFYDRTGQSLRKFLLRTPVDGARMSSRFGMRKHPILGYSRMHKGVDFAAPTGTPIYAAGSGRIESAGRKGGYGKYVRIRHNGEYSTAYAHLSRIAKGIRPGARVRQGQVIGFVGSTGRSTGPHLHYEVLKNGSQMNPLKLRQPPSTQLTGQELNRFRVEMARIDRLRDDVEGGTRIASRTP